MRIYTLLILLLFPVVATAQRGSEPLLVQFTDGTSQYVQGLTAEEGLVGDSCVIVQALYKTLEISRIENSRRKDFGHFPDHFARQSKEKFGVFLEYAVDDKNPEYDWNNHKRILEHTVQRVLYKNEHWIGATNSFNARLKGEKQKSEQWMREAENPNREKPLYADVWLLIVKEGEAIKRYIVFDTFRD